MSKVPCITMHSVASFDRDAVQGASIKLMVVLFCYLLKIDRLKLVSTCN